ITEKTCDYCLKKVPVNAVRCPECTTWLDWDACAKVANMERVATSAVNTSGIAPIPMPYADYPAGEFQQAQTNLGRF
ncbi:hypothetical protein BGZ51_001324, partial [Haplosporangium sp. Z 767]